MAKVPITRSFVLGSTSAVAQALCQEPSQRGCCRIHLVTRDGEPNERLATAPTSLHERLSAVVSAEHTDLFCDDGSLETRRMPWVGKIKLYLLTPGSVSFTPALPRQH
jgi:decaprenylphospho-beta-D-erythro-pentofuranosid-2-ulose 2-reductase